jgi:hypothetical protein
MAADYTATTRYWKDLRRVEFRTDELQIARLKYFLEVPVSGGSFAAEKLLLPVPYRINKKQERFLLDERSAAPQR